MAHYLYLPRVRDADVVLGAIHDGLEQLTWKTDTFAYAESWDEARSRYLGLRSGITTGQSVHFELNANNPALFAAQPAIDAAGQLTFEPKVGATGTATVSVFAVDDDIVVSFEKPWHNRHIAADVNNDSHVAANDVVAVLNYINAFGSGAVPDNASYSQPFLDVDGDGNIAPNDALAVINAINSGQNGEGENQVTQMIGIAQSAGDLLALLASDPAIQATRRRQ
jgi:hypothetical protein